MTKIMIRINIDQNQDQDQDQDKMSLTLLSIAQSTLKFKVNRKPQTRQEKIQKNKLNRTSPKHDLTVDKTRKEVQAQVHQSSYGHNSETNTPKLHTELNLDLENEKSSSPKPVLPGEKIYSLKALQEKCRKMIAGSKPFQDSTRL